MNAGLDSVMCLSCGTPEQRCCAGEKKCLEGSCHLNICRKSASCGLEGEKCCNDKKCNNPYYCWVKSHMCQTREDYGTSLREAIAASDAF